MTLAVAVITGYLVISLGASLLVVAMLRNCHHRIDQEVTVPRISMCLTHDETLGLHCRKGQVEMRIRVWQEKNKAPLVLVEPLTDPARHNGFLTGSAATYVHHCLFHGLRNDFIFCEHDPSSHSWTCVHFDVIRHRFVESRRHHLDKIDVEDHLGAIIEN